MGGSIDLTGSVLLGGGADVGPHEIEMHSTERLWASAVIRLKSSRIASFIPATAHRLCGLGGEGP